jgi:hypothetical protein
MTQSLGLHTRTSRNWASSLLYWIASSLFRLDVYHIIKIITLFSVNQETIAASNCVLSKDKERTESVKANHARSIEHNA